MKKLLALALLAGATVLGACTPQQGNMRPVVMAPVQQQLARVQPMQACDTSFRVVNQSGLTVRELYFSHSSLNGWGPDQLRTSVLPPGRFLSYRAGNTGRYDFRVVWNNGRSSELRGVNVCALRSIAIRNNGLRAF